MPRPSQQQGFSAIHIILTIVVVAVIAGVGFYVWRDKPNNNKSVAAATSASQKTSPIASFADCQKSMGSVMLETYPEQCVTKTGQTFTDPSQTAPSAADSTSYLVIKEWGVRMKLTNNISDAYYSFTTSPSYAFLSTKSLVAIAPDCAPDKTSLGVIFRQSTAEYQAALADQQANGPNIDNGTGTIHIGDYYYGYTSPQAGCTDNNSTAAAQYEIDRPAIVAAAKTLESVPTN